MREDTALEAARIKAAGKVYAEVFTAAWLKSQNTLDAMILATKAMNDFRECVAKDVHDS